MSRIIFILLLFLAAIVRAPISICLIILKNFLRPLKKRIDFERKNLIEDQCRSFKMDFLVADYCFEVSSEGELEQVRPLIEYYLQKKKRVEILFASASVEKKCLKLASEYAEQVRVLRLPIASFFPVPFLFFQAPWFWVSAPIIIFCRYDFFPELLSFKFLGKKLILLSATGKRESWFKKEANAFFDLIVAANETEAQYFRNSSSNTRKIFSFDFRIPRIFTRFKKALETLKSVEELSEYLSYLDFKLPSQKLIMGSAWQSDLVVFQNDPAKWAAKISSGELHLLVVPHDLNPKSIEDLKNSLKSLFPTVPLYEIKKGEKHGVLALSGMPGIVILNMSGVLCEMYSRFQFAYVGGGFERSIHSVLEPFLCGCIVACGPKINRSTEYDFIFELAPEEIHLLKNLESFYNLIQANKAPEISIRNNLSDNAGIVMESIIKEIESC